MLFVDGMLMFCLSRVNLYRGSDGPLNNIAELGKLHVDKTVSLCVY